MAGHPHVIVGRMLSKTLKRGEGQERGELTFTEFCILFFLNLVLTIIPLRCVNNLLLNR